MKLSIFCFFLVVGLLIARIESQEDPTKVGDFIGYYSIVNKLGGRVLTNANNKAVLRESLCFPEQQFEVRRVGNVGTVYIIIQRHTKYVLSKDVNSDETYPPLVFTPYS